MRRKLLAISFAICELVGCSEGIKRLAIAPKMEVKLTHAEGFMFPGIYEVKSCSALQGMMLSEVVKSPPFYCQQHPMKTMLSGAQACSIAKLVAKMPQFVSATTRVFVGQSFLAATSTDSTVAAYHRLNGGGDAVWIDTFGRVEHADVDRTTIYRIEIPSALNPNQFVLRVCVVVQM